MVAPLNAHFALAPRLQTAHNAHLPITLIIQLAHIAPQNANQHAPFRMEIWSAINAPPGISAQTAIVVTHPAKLAQIQLPIVILAVMENT